MKQKTVGPNGEPKVTVVGGIHGDEPCGVEAVRRLSNANFDWKRPVQFIIGNPRAVGKSRRYVQKDLNRAFPGCRNSDVYEERRASELMELFQDTVVLSIHSTQSTSTPFAICNFDNCRTMNMAQKLPVEYIVDHDNATPNALTQHVDAIEIEAGRQFGKKTPKKAVKFGKYFLQITDAIPGSPPESVDSSYFVLKDTIKKPEPNSKLDGECKDIYSIHVSNFEKVGKGEVFAQYNDTIIRSDDEFYPVLVSPCGYSDVFGFKAEKVKF